jgi:tetratricopeptide (TPR) repeat protein
MPENPRIEELRRRVQADPASIAFAALAEEYRRQARYEEAIEACLAGLQRHPAYLSARVTLGRALLETGNLDAAREQFETVLNSAPENIAATRGLAQIHERRGHSTEMDPHLAQLMREHTEAALAAPAPPLSPPPPPEPIRFEPRTMHPAPAPAGPPDFTPESDTLDLHDLDLSLNLEALNLSPSTPELQSSIAALSNLQRFLAAIQHARHAA